MNKVKSFWSNSTAARGLGRIRGKSVCPQEGKSIFLFELEKEKDMEKIKRQFSTVESEQIKDKSRDNAKFLAGTNTVDAECDESCAWDEDSKNDSVQEKMTKIQRNNNQPNNSLKTSSDESCAWNEDNEIKEAVNGMKTTTS